MTDLAITNVFTVSVSATPAGVGAYNTSNLAIFTRETAGGGFGSLGYKLYVEPTEVTTDFGTGSATALMANSVFSQQPNILAGGGYLAVIPFLDGNDEVQHLAFSGTPASGVWSIQWHQYTTTDLAFDADAAAVQTALRLIPGLSHATVTGTYGAGFDITFIAVGGAVAAVTTTDTLQTSAPAAITITVTTTTPGTNETIAAAVTRTAGLVQYFGLMTAEITNDTDLLAGAAVIQPLNKIAFWVSRTLGDLAPSAILDDLVTGSFTQNRGLFYGGADDDEALVMMAAYAGRALSTDFSGSNTTQNMHLKDLVGVQPDPLLTQTYLTQAQDAGADVYISIQGVPKVFTSGANRFFDQVYNQQWFVGALQVAGFNALAQTSTKIPQTEAGMDIIKSALNKVCTLAVTNQYVAPGSWNSASTFGNLADFLRNIREVGFYVYSQPITLQLQVDREARLAPLIQIAIKEAGALNKGNVLVFINA